MTLRLCIRLTIGLVLNRKRKIRFIILKNNRLILIKNKEIILIFNNIYSIF